MSDRSRDAIPRGQPKSYYERMQAIVEALEAQLASQPPPEDIHITEADVTSTELHQMRVKWQDMIPGLTPDQHIIDSIEEMEKLLKKRSK